MLELRVDDLVHVYPQGAVHALDSVDLRIPAGQRVGLVGQNGSGKTTLVRHLNGLLRPTSGRVEVGGTDAIRLTVAQLARRVGLVFQDPDRQIFAGTVRAEVEFGPRNLGMDGSALREAVGAALEVTGLGGEERTNPYDLGQARRKLLALASVLAMRTPVLVIDEPTTGQDAAGVRRVREIVDQVAAESRTVIAVSHDMGFVAQAFERVVVMRAGRVILDGTPAEVFSSRNSDTLATTYLEPPWAAVVGDRLGVGPTPTDESLIAALGRAGSPRERRLAGN